MKDISSIIQEKLTLELSGPSFVLFLQYFLPHVIKSLPDNVLRMPTTFN